MKYVFGLDGFEYLAEHPEEAAVFNEAMAEITRQVAKAVVAGYDFAPFSAIVDVGGGNGTLISSILNAAPKLRGIIFDTESGSAEAAPQLEASGVGPVRSENGGFLRFGAERRGRLYPQEHYP